MRLEQLQHVIAIADNHSFNQAAKALYISQPSLSVSLQALESEVGFQIFQRSYRGTVLTPEGEELYRIACKVQRELDKIPSIAAESDTDNHVSLHAAPVFCNALMFRLLNMVSESSNIRLAVTEIERDAALQSIMEGTANFSIGMYVDGELEDLSRIAAQNQIIMETLVNDRVFAYLSSQHPLSREESVFLYDLEDHTPQVLQMNHRNNEVMQNHDERYYAFTERDSVLKAVSKNLGFALLPGIMAVDNIYVGTELVNVVPLADGVAISTLYLAYSMEKPLTEKERLVRDKIIALGSITQDEINKRIKPNSNHRTNHRIELVY